MQWRLPHPGPAPATRGWPWEDRLPFRQFAGRARSKPPGGKRMWTLRLLAERMVELNYVGSISHETVRQALQKTS